MMVRIAIIGVAGWAGAALADATMAAPARAADEQRAVAQRQDSEFSSQERRVRPRIRVYRDYQPPFWDYPRPGTYSWPGPNAKRDCRAWYVLENRPSGAVMTPRQQCWWVPG